MPLLLFHSSTPIVRIADMASSPEDILQACANRSRICSGQRVARHAVRRVSNGTTTTTVGFHRSPRLPLSALRNQPARIMRKLPQLTVICRNVLVLQARRLVKYWWRMAAWAIEAGNLQW